MAQQRDVIGPREFMSYQWYRKIGDHRYRFRYNPKPGVGHGAFEVIADRFVRWMEWERIHTLLIKKEN